MSLLIRKYKTAFENDRLLRILLPQPQVVRLHGIQEPRHDRAHAGVVSGPRRALENIGQALDEHARPVAGRVDVLHLRLPHQVHAIGRELRAVTRGGPRIAGVVLARAELQRIDEDAHHHSVGHAACQAHERQVSFVQRPHGGHERQAFAAGTEAHYYLRIRMADNQTVWTGPVYVTYDPAAVTGVDDGVRPEASFAIQARPNPMVSRVTASFTLSHAADRADLAVYDAAGRRVTTLLNGPLTAGHHSIDWTGQDDYGRNMSAGIYFLKLNAGQRQAVQKVLLLK